MLAFLHRTVFDSLMTRGLNGRSVLWIMGIRYGITEIIKMLMSKYTMKKTITIKKHKNRIKNFILAVIVGSSMIATTVPAKASSLIESPAVVVAKAEKGTNPDKSLGDSKSVFDWLQRAVNVLSGVTGLVILLSLIVAGIQYTTARDNASQAAAARDRIRDLALIVIPLYVFGYALLQWLIPGGVFNK